MSSHGGSGGGGSGNATSIQSVAVDATPPTDGQVLVYVAADAQYEAEATPAGTPATAVTGPDAFGASAVIGTGTNYARQDHNHGLPAAPSDLPLAGGTMSGAIAMGSHKITGLADGTTSGDAAGFDQLPSVPAAGSTVTGPDSFGDSAAAGSASTWSASDHDHGLPAAPSDLPLAGGTMSGAIAMGTNKITGLGDGSDPQDAVAFGQLPSGVTPATTVTGPDSFGASAVVGTGTEFARQDHDHGLPSAPSDLPLAGGTMSGAIAMGSHKITGLADGSDPQDAACFGQITGGGGGGPLGIVEYAPSSYTAHSTTSSTLAAVDATNLTISFTAPASGDVLVRLTGHSLSLGGNAYWALLDHTSSARVGSSGAVTESGTGANVTLALLITGLTPSDVYQYDWALAAQVGGTAYLVIQGASSGLPTQVDGSPAVMEVWPAP